MSQTRAKNRIVFELSLEDNVFTCFLDPVDRKNLNVTIKPNNEIWLSKPDALTLDNLKIYLQKNNEWILERARSINQTHTRRNSHIKDDHVMIFGYKVYYKDYPDVLDHLPEILMNYVEVNRRHFDEVFGKNPTIEVVKLKGRWGACSPSMQNILLNERLVHYPINCANYVIIHEYLHLIVPNHSERFYALLEEIMPDYQKYVDYMKEH